MLNFLKQKNINKIYLTGIDIDACVLASAFDGFDLGYDIEILQDFLSKSFLVKNLNTLLLKLCIRT